MSKRKKKTSKKRVAARDAEVTGARNACLDTLRGLAIVLMIIDHVAWLFFDQQIEAGSIRLLTRLSMPLFCVLTGYFAVARRGFHRERWTQVAVAAVAVNIVYVALYRRLEILASLLVGYTVLAVVGKPFVIGTAAFLLFPIDSSEAVFDFPLSAVITCMAIGVLQRLYGWRVSVSASIAIASALWVAFAIQGDFQLVSPPTVYVLLFLPLAALLLAFGVAHPKWRWGWLEWIGRYPLSIYVGQYTLLLLLSTP